MPKPGGRRDTPEAIRAAAADLFARDGYAGVSVRDIAAVAAVDPALVIRHFGSKEALFLETMSLETMSMDSVRGDGWGATLDGDLGNLGERFLAGVLESESQVRGVFLALLRASDAGEVNLRLREVHEHLFVEPLRSRLAGPDADVRARLAAALVGGLLYAMWVVGDEDLVAADRPEVIRRYGALLQRLLADG